MSKELRIYCELRIFLTKSSPVGLGKVLCGVLCGLVRGFHEIFPPSEVLNYLHNARITQAERKRNARENKNVRLHARVKWNASYILWSLEYGILGYGERILGYGERILGYGEQTNNKN